MMYIYFFISVGTNKWRAMNSYKAKHLKPHGSMSWLMPNLGNFFFVSEGEKNQESQVSP